MVRHAKAISRLWIGLVVFTLWPIASIHAETLPGHEAPVIGIGWLWDDDPQDCYKSKSTKCNNRFCLRALLVSCTYKFSSDRFKKNLGQCIFGHLKFIRNKWSAKAVMDGCTTNLKAKNSFYMSFGACVADQAGQIYDADTYRRARGICKGTVKDTMRLFPETREK